MKQINGKYVASSFADLQIVVTDSGETKLVTAEQLAAIEGTDDLSYLNADKEMLDSFRAGDQGEWLDGRDPTIIGLIRRTVFLEASFLSDETQVFLEEQGYSSSWMANQGMMLSAVHCFGLPKVTMIYLAKSLNFGGETFKHNYPIVPNLKDIKEYAKNEIDGIWVWDEEAAGEEATANEDAWVAHPQLLQKMSYSDLTDAEEGAVMAYVQRNYLANSGMRVISGFSMLYGTHRYCMVMPDFMVEAASGRITSKKTGKVASASAMTGSCTAAPEMVMSSMWELRDKVCIRYPRFLETKHAIPRTQVSGTR